MKLNTLILTVLLISVLTAQKPPAQGETNKLDVMKEMSENDKKLNRYWKMVNRNNNTGLYIGVVGRVSYLNLAMQKSADPSVQDNSSMGIWDAPGYEPTLKFEMETPKDRGVSMGFVFGLNMNYDKNVKNRFKVIHNYTVHMNLNTALGGMYFAFGGPRYDGLTKFGFSHGGNWLELPFERNAWDSFAESEYKYKDMVTLKEEGSDARAGGAGSKGIYFDWSEAPLGFHIRAFWGKTDNGDVFWQKASSLSYYLLERKFADLKIGLNGSHYLVNTNNFYLNQKGIHHIVAYAGYDHKKAGHIFAEYGRSISQSQFHPSYSGNAFYAEYRRKFKKAGKMLLEGSFSYVDQYFDSEMTAVKNTYNPVGEYTGFQSNISYNNISTGDYLSPDEGAKVKSSQYENRWCTKLGTGFEFLNMRLALDYRYSRSIAPTTNIVTYSHDLNHDIWWWQMDKWGKNMVYAGEINGSFYLNKNDWRTVPEAAFLADGRSHRRSYDEIRLLLTVDLSRYMPFLKESYIYTYYVQRSMWNKYKLHIPINDKGRFAPVFSGNIGYFFWAQKLHTRLWLVFFTGSEKWYSDDTIETISIKDNGIGGGIDFQFTPYSTLFFRVRGYNHERLGHPDSQMKGVLSSVELKVRF